MEGHEVPRRTWGFRPQKPVKHTRADLRAQLPPGYRWWRHAGTIALISGGTMAVCAWNLSAVRPWEWLGFFGALLLANFGEYWLHRIPFHNPRIPDFTYYAHTATHHAFFNYERMAVNDLNDLRYVMFEVWVVPLMIAGVMPIFLALHHWVSANFAWLYLLAVMVYYSVYEVTHVLAHLSPESLLGRNHLVQRFSYHHRVHHDSRLMRRYNFNFALPIFDWIFGTKYPSRAYQPRVRENDAAVRPAATISPRPRSSGAA